MESVSLNQRSDENVFLSSNDEMKQSQTSLLNCSNLVSLKHLCSSTVVECLQLRYLHNEFYTWAGPTLVAINPCTDVPKMYNNQAVDSYYEEIKTGTTPFSPHLFALVGIADHRRSCRLGKVNQAVIVSGESGAGKTESARYMLKYLCEVVTKNSTHNAEAVVSDTLSKVLASNPLLESFGNAATVKNHNSSRFGKLLKIQYVGNDMKGATINTYLLEKTRVMHQPQEEKNFHILHQVAAGLTHGVFDKEGKQLVFKETFKELKQKKAGKFSIIPADDSVERLKDLQKTLEAFHNLCFSLEGQQDIIRILIAILYLGNICFTEDRHYGGTAFTVSDESMSDLSHASSLLGLNTSDLIRSLTVKSIAVSARKKVSLFTKPFERSSDCRERQSSLLQLLYNSLFTHLVDVVNLQITAPQHTSDHFFGILDVYGFEALECNGLEQLCINYANERLQQTFNYTFLQTERKVLLEEGVVHEATSDSNPSCLHDLHSTVSVFAILNEQCQLNRSLDDEAAVDRIGRALKHSDFLEFPSSRKGSACGFVVRHYAGPVFYRSDSLLKKNKDHIPTELLTMLSLSENSFVSKIIDRTEAAANQSVKVKKSNSNCKIEQPMSLESYFQSPTPSPSLTGSVSSGSRAMKKVTTLSKFKSSLDTLLSLLEKCDLHYTKCVKPNSQGMPGSVCPDYLLHQLATCGILDTVAISHAGYPVRMQLEEFITRYSTSSVTSTDTSNELVRHLLNSSLSAGRHDLYRIGKQKVFLSEIAFREMENMKELKRNNAATLIQSHYRRYQCQKDFKKLCCTNRKATIIQKNARAWLVRRKYLTVLKSVVVIQRNVRLWLSTKENIEDENESKYFGSEEESPLSLSSDSESSPIFRNKATGFVRNRIKLFDSSFDMSDNNSSLSNTRAFNNISIAAPQKNLRTPTEKHKLPPSINSSPDEKVKKSYSHAEFNDAMVTKRRKTSSRRSKVQHSLHSKTKAMQNLPDIIPSDEQINLNGESSTQDDVDLVTKTSRCLRKSYSKNKGQNPLPVKCHTNDKFKDVTTVDLMSLSDVESMVSNKNIDSCVNEFCEKHPSALNVLFNAKSKCDSRSEELEAFLQVALCLFKLGVFYRTFHATAMSKYEDQPNSVNYSQMIATSIKEDLSSIYSSGFSKFACAQYPTFSHLINNENLFPNNAIVYSCDKKSPKVLVLPNSVTLNTSCHIYYNLRKERSKKLNLLYAFGSFKEAFQSVTVSFHKPMAMMYRKKFLYCCADGILSCRYSPPVKFHTRSTCLSGSQQQPTLLRTAGLADAFLLV